MATARRRANMLSLLMEFNPYFLSQDIPRYSTRTTSKYGVWLTNVIAVVDSETGNPAGNADFSIYFNWNEPILNYRIKFHGAKSQYLNRKNNLKDVLMERVHTALQAASKYDQWNLDDLLSGVGNAV
jgi:hypothetical protein